MAWFHAELNGMVAFYLETWDLNSQELEKL